MKVCRNHLRPINSYGLYYNWG